MVQGDCPSRGQGGLFCVGMQPSLVQQDLDYREGVE